MNYSSPDQDEFLAQTRDQIDDERQPEAGRQKLPGNDKKVVQPEATEKGDNV